MVETNIRALESNNKGHYELNLLASNKKESENLRIRFWGVKKRQKKPRERSSWVADTRFGEDE